MGGGMLELASNEPSARGVLGGRGHHAQCADTQNCHGRPQHRARVPGHRPPVTVGQSVGRGRGRREGRRFRWCSANIDWGPASGRGHRSLRGRGWGSLKDPGKRKAIGLVPESSQGVARPPQEAGPGLRSPADRLSGSAPEGPGVTAAGQASCGGDPCPAGETAPGSRPHPALHS